jgi:hypothetical protein
VLTVLDVFSRQCLVLDAATHFPAARVTLVLDRIIGQRSQPSVMTLDNGPGLTYKCEVTGLVVLRNHCAKVGVRDQERQITFVEIARPAGPREEPGAPYRSR